LQKIKTGGSLGKKQRNRQLHAGKKMRKKEKKTIPFSVS
jgi:hypothetical protein